MAGNKAKTQEGITNSEDSKKPVGRPTQYKSEYCDLAKKFCLLGATDKELAAMLNIAESTLNLWKETHKEFMESINAGKDEADAIVASKLFHRATGYEHPDTDIRAIDGQVVMTPVTKHYPPDTAAAIFWLKNRQRGKWRDKIETELSGDLTVKQITGMEVK